MRRSHIWLYNQYYLYITLGWRLLGSILFPFIHRSFAVLPFCSITVGSNLHPFFTKRNFWLLPLCVHYFHTTAYVYTYIYITMTWSSLHQLTYDLTHSLPIRFSTPIYCIQQFDMSSGSITPPLFSNSHIYCLWIPTGLPGSQ